MPFLTHILLRVLLLAVGLVAAAVVTVVFVLFMAAWLLRAGWARLTGRPVTPFGMRMGPRSVFEEMMRRAPQPPASRTPRADAAAVARGRLADVSDVEPK
ncbi:MAG TPA: hypothetical protein VF522_12835 [Ramlibacter sp.]|uniref:hypothetical protein n=1 Tax=Ramlibacter sp. TaxID=1917967 RepID=UPI002ED6569D